MPANLTPQYLDAEQRYKKARTTEDKIAALEEMYAVIPKHKGTDKLQGEIKARLKKLRSEGQKKTARHSFSYNVPPEGAGQVFVIGPPNAGKSALIKSLTNAEPEVADYPFTTRTTLPAMMMVEDIQIQLVDTPAISREYMEKWLTSVIRCGDGALFVVDIGDDDVLTHIDDTLSLLEESKISLVKEYPQDPGDDLGRSYLPTWMVAHKSDHPNALHNLEIVKEFYGDRFQILVASALTGEGLESIRQETWILLKMIRVYSKIPGKPVDMKAPFTLTRGSTVIHLARKIHKDIEKNFNFARLWGEGRPDGIRVPRDYELQDKDVVEIHA